jgi:uroporphyrinogen decarboxylase
MTSKERVRIALSKGKPDRAPLYADFVPGVTKKLMETLKIYSEPELSLALGNDMILTGHGISTSYYAKEDDEYICEWGCKWEYFSNLTGRHPEIVVHPLEQDEDGSLTKQYKIPDPYDDKRYEGSKEIIKKYGNDYWIVGSIPCSIYEASWYLRGMQKFMEDMILDKEYVNELMDKVMEFPLVAGKKLIGLGVDMLWLGDDVGMQSGMMMSPDTWREYLKPRMAKLISEFKKENPDIKVAYHSCGDVQKIIPELIEIGLDVLNPVQPLSMDPARLKEMYGNELCFWGSMDVQGTLPNGTSEDIWNEVRLRMQTIGKNGGLILSPAHTIQCDTSVENILAFYEAAKELGKY